MSSQIHCVFLATSITVAEEPDADPSVTTEEPDADPLVTFEVAVVVFLVCRSVDALYGLDIGAASRSLAMTCARRS